MLNKILEGVSTIAIGGHVRPDGDCVGSCVGLGQYIRENYSDKTVDIYLKDIPESFHFLKGTETILESVADEEKEYDLFIALDCGDTGRLDYSKPLLDHAKHTFCVDHHISNIGTSEFLNICGYTETYRLLLHPMGMVQSCSIERYKPYIKCRDLRNGFLQRMARKKS